VICLAVDSKGGTKSVSFVPSVVWRVAIKLSEPFRCCIVSRVGRQLTLVAVIVLGQLPRPSVVVLETIIIGTRVGGMVLERFQQTVESDCK
jgi:hypothetical protein